MDSTTFATALTTTRRPTRRDFPPLTQKKIKRCQTRPVNLLSVSGWIELEVLYGWDRFNQQWLCPARIALGLERYQQMSPELEDRLCFTATESGSYERAAKVAGK